MINARIIMPKGKFESPIFCHANIEILNYLFSAISRINLDNLKY